MHLLKRIAIHAPNPFGVENVNGHAPALQRGATQTCLEPRRPLLQLFVKERSSLFHACLSCTSLEGGGMSINISNSKGIRCMYGNSIEQEPSRPLLSIHVLTFIEFVS